MKKRSHIAIGAVIVLAIFAFISLELQSTTNNDTIFNPDSKITATVTDLFIVHSISPESQTIGVSFGDLIISENQNFSFYLIIPTYGCQFFENGTEENNSVWYQIVAKNNYQYPYFPIRSIIDNNIFPIDSYFSDFYIVLEGKPKVVYNQYLSLHPVFDQSLSRQSVWSISENVDSEDRKSFTGYCPQTPVYQTDGDNITVIHHKVTLSHSWLTTFRDWLYIGAIGIPLLLMGGHYRYMWKEDDLTKQAGLFMGIIVLFLTELFGLQQIQQSYGVIAEIILIPSMAVYSYMFVRILKRIKENPPSQN